jgi:hypothetical protein
MKAGQAMQRHWPQLLAGLIAAGLAAVFARELPATIRYIKMERM